jgi:hypothetical protein
LQPNEERPVDNLNKTLYRDQINKVAGAIKEIIQGMKAEPIMKAEGEGRVKDSVKNVKPEEIKGKK